jgi:hypothetical protein
MTTRIVQNYGLFWERETVTWGTPGGKGKGKGHLRGYLKAESASVDFRDQRGIYILYEGQSIAQQRVVYIGQAGAGAKTLFNRLSDHRKDHLWNRWQRFSWFGLLDVGKGNVLTHADKSGVGHLGVSVALNQIEGILIALLEPLQNKQGPKWAGANEYFQLDGENEGATKTRT